ncbi:sterol desaturase family protein [Sandarakinorhabdus sp. AAP62]|uniref:sterol desaturase family protein n=1 Tax=Sandarakinorhabdus sp. AAP62 TaxID=1248916 RepID=UPI0002DB396C|nr:sterol desaturase family protein [Sandarakinorhabdus sp. AAP62]
MLANEPAIRLAAFAGMLAVMLLWEQLSPRRAPPEGNAVRRLNNLALVALDTLLLRLAFPVLAVGFADAMEQRSFGLFNAVALPDWLAVLLAIMLLDLAIYWQHRLFHLIPWLWRLHRVHHADPAFDTTTALRFHPLEIMVSMLIKLAVVAALGAPPLAVLLFEVILNATAMFNHGNVSLPAALEARLRLVLVTPDLHRVHHSVHGDELNRNFGFNLSLWDRLFGSLAAQPRDGHDRMTIGLKDFRDSRAQWLDRLLLQPFRSSGD